MPSWFELFIFLGVPLIVSMLKYFDFGLKSYINKKFENIATKQDAKDLTVIVEGVKKSFQDDTEKLKSELSILISKHNLIFSEEKEAIVQYLSAWDVWFASLKQNFIEEYNISNYSEMKKIKIKYQNEFDTVLMKKSKLELFINHVDIIVSTDLLISSTFKLHNHNIKYINAIHFNYYRIEKNKTDLKDDYDLEKIQSEELKKLGDLIVAHSEAVNNYYAEIVESRRMFIDTCQAYIRKDIKE
jgi:hypothetical protein